MKICLLFAATVWLAGCTDDPIVWKHSVASPNGQWIATAVTKQWGGFGSAWVETTVSLKKRDGTVDRGRPFDILSYPGGGSIPQTYKFSNANADQDLKIRWLTPTRLLIAHATAIDPDLEVIRFSNIDIGYDLVRQ